MSDKERADKLRAAIGILEDIGFDEQADDLRDELIWIVPPKPQYEDGTIAWIKVEVDPCGVARYLAVRHGDYWVYAWEHESGQQTRGAWTDVGVREVMPLRILGDDQIAVKRIWSTCSASNWRGEAKNVWAHDYPTHAAATLCNAYADALEAEEQARS